LTDRRQAKLNKLNKQQIGKTHNNRKRRTNVWKTITLCILVGNLRRLWTLWHQGVTS